MTDIAIHADSLSKSYKIGAQGTPPLGRLSELLVALPHTLSQRTRNLLSSSLHKAPLASQESGRRDVFWALKDVSFEVRQGEIVGVIGRNGAGKSTLLKILSRITEPTHGRFGLRGRVASLLEVGTGFHSELTGRENIFVSGVILGMKRAEVKRRFDEIVDFSGVGKFLDTPVKHYSSGMQVRLGFAVAAHLESEILIIDEVLAVGDAQFQTKCLGKLTSVANSGRTILFVSHNLTAVNSLCETAIWVEGGKVIERGAAQKITGMYEAKSTAQQLENTWESPDVAPGSDRVRLKRIAICADKQPDSTLSLQTPIELQIDYWVMQDGVTLNPSVVLQMNDGSPVFNTVPVDSAHAGLQALNKGLYRSSCFIPANLLNDELYRIQLHMYSNLVQREFILNDAVCFQVSDTQQRIGWYGKWIGTVRPALSWKFAPLANELASDSSLSKDQAK